MWCNRYRVLFAFVGDSIFIEHGQDMGLVKLENNGRAFTRGWMQPWQEVSCLARHKVHESLEPISHDIHVMPRQGISKQNPQLEQTKPLSQRHLESPRFACWTLVRFLTSCQCSRFKAKALKKYLYYGPRLERMLGLRPLVVGYRVMRDS